VYFIIVVPDVNYIHLYLSHKGMASAKLIPTVATFVTL